MNNPGERFKKYSGVSLFFGRSGDGPVGRSHQDAREYSSYRFTAQFRENRRSARALRPDSKNEGK